MRQIFESSDIVEQFGETRSYGLRRHATGDALDTQFQRASSQNRGYFLYTFHSSNFHQHHGFKPPIPRV